MSVFFLPPAVFPITPLTWSLCASSFPPSFSLSPFVCPFLSSLPSLFWGLFILLERWMRGWSHLQELIKPPSHACLRTRAHTHTQSHGFSLAQTHMATQTQHARRNVRCDSSRGSACMNMQPGGEARKTKTKASHTESDWEEIKTFESPCFMPPHWERIQERTENVVCDAEICWCFRLQTAATALISAYEKSCINKTVPPCD